MTKADKVKVIKNRSLRLGGCSASLKNSEFASPHLEYAPVIIYYISQLPLFLTLPVSLLWLKSWYNHNFSILLFMHRYHFSFLCRSCIKLFPLYFCTHSSNRIISIYITAGMNYDKCIQIKVYKDKNFVLDRQF